MAQMLKFARMCRRCGTRVTGDATRCPSCGTDLSAAAESAAPGPEDPALLHVEASDRVVVRRFERDSEAELAAGLLRANGIPAELSPMMIPGLPADMALWVHKRDLETALDLLPGAESNETEGETAP
jgi:hypothetical protein